MILDQVLVGATLEKNKFWLPRFWGQKFWWFLGVQFKRLLF